MSEVVAENLELSKAVVETPELSKVFVQNSELSIAPVFNLLAGKITALHDSPTTKKPIIISNFSFSSVPIFSF